MTRRAVCLSEEKVFTADFALSCFLSVETTVNIQFRSRWKIEQLLKLRHKMRLRRPLENIHALLRGDDRIAVEISSALLELGEVLRRS